MFDYKALSQTKKDVWSPALFVPNTSDLILLEKQAHRETAGCTRQLCHFDRLKKGGSGTWISKASKTIKDRPTRRIKK